MTTETQERIDSDVDATNVEWATKADVDVMSKKVAEQGLEVGKAQVTLKWLAGILGGLFLMVAVLAFLLLVIALQL